MIPLFHIPTHVIDTAQFSNLLSGKIVRQFEERFAEYVGAKYAVSLHSATAGIFLAFQDEWGTEVSIPSILPPVVANALIRAGAFVSFEDNVDWVGGSYILYRWTDCKFIDSAQRVEKDQYKNEAADKDLMLFSFFPTKPISSCDGGMIVSNDKQAIEDIRVMANNGMEQQGENSWDKKQTAIGYKMYMNSIQAWIANENFELLNFKKAELAEVGYEYNKAFGLHNSSEHLYRIPVKDNRSFVEKAKQAGICCGIHYEALHHNPIFLYEGPDLPKSDEAARTMVSIPYHEMLSWSDQQKVIQFVKKNR